MATTGLSESDAGQAGRWGEVHPGPPPETDAELAEALKAGNAGAAGRLYDRHAASVLGLVYRLLGREADSEDVAQEVFIYAFSSIDKLREPAALKGWLLGVAAGKVRSHLRRRRRQRWLHLLPHEELPEVPVESSDPHTGLLRQVYRILDDLPPDDRIAIVMRRIEGLPVEDAAKACGMSLSTFKRRLTRGEARFLARAKQQPALASWLNGGAS
ncbi:MAG TPA: RNA polymerase sigma factor [Polyangiaceae bacterium]